MITREWALTDAMTAYREYSTYCAVLIGVTYRIRTTAGFTAYEIDMKQRVELLIGQAIDRVRARRTFFLEFTSHSVVP